MACQSLYLGVKVSLVLPHAGTVVTAHRSAFADEESSDAAPQALDQAQPAAVHPAAAPGQAPPSSHALASPPDRAPVEAGSQAGTPRPGGSSIAGAAQAAAASAAQEWPASQTSEAALQAQHGLASPRAPPSSNGDLGEGGPASEPWQRARALNEERDLAARLRRHVAEVPGPSTCRHAWDHAMRCAVMLDTPCISMLSTPLTPVVHYETHVCRCDACCPSFVMDSVMGSRH